MYPNNKKGQGALATLTLFLKAKNNRYI